MNDSFSDSVRELQRGIDALTRDLISEWCDVRGVPADGWFVDYLFGLAEVLPLGDVLRSVDRDLYEAVKRDQAVEARVEALSDR